ncbi:hypothetical protein ACS0TY_009800 [Phlomoides rotata]
MSTEGEPRCNSQANENAPPWTFIADFTAAQESFTYCKGEQFPSQLIDLPRSEIEDLGTPAPEYSI